MFGQDWENVVSSNNQFPIAKKGYQNTFIPDNIDADLHKVGLIPRVINNIMKENEDGIYNDQIMFFVSFLQIYNEKILDLLQDK